MSNEKIEWGTYQQLLDSHPEEFEFVVRSGTVRQVSAWSTPMDPDLMPHEHVLFLLHNKGEFVWQRHVNGWKHQVSDWNQEYTGYDAEARKAFLRLRPSPLIKEADPELERLLAEQDLIDAEDALLKARKNYREWNLKCRKPVEYRTGSAAVDYSNTDSVGYRDVRGGARLFPETARWTEVAEAIRRNISTYPIVESPDSVLFPNKEQNFCVFFDSKGDVELSHDDGETWRLTFAPQPTSANGDAPAIEFYVSLTEDQMMSMLANATEDIEKIMAIRQEEGKEILTPISIGASDAVQLDTSHWRFLRDGVRRAKMASPEGHKLTLDFWKQGEEDVDSQG